MSRRQRIRDYYRKGRDLQTLPRTHDATTSQIDEDIIMVKLKNGFEKAINYLVKVGLIKDTGNDNIEVTEKFTVKFVDSLGEGFRKRKKESVKDIADCAIVLTILSCGPLTQKELNDATDIIHCIYEHNHWGDEIMRILKEKPKKRLLVKSMTELRPTPIEHLPAISKEEKEEFLKLCLDLLNENK